MSEGFKFSSAIKSDLLDDLERIVGRIKDGSLSAEQVANKLRMLAARSGSESPGAPRRAAACVVAAAIDVQPSSTGGAASPLNVESHHG